ncbi:MAG TPA: protein-glutamate O-methyltransferase CheR, partial [Candidatus Binatia bacterium]
MPLSPPPSSQTDLLLLRDLLEKKTGLYIADEKAGRLEEPFAELCSIHRRGAGEILRAIDLGDADGRRYLDRVVAAIATNETYFFRIPAHFETLKNYLLPEIIERKKLAGEKTLRIWSAGCSTGEEPYSVAIFLLEHFPELLSWQVRIIATDIDLDALGRAGQGVYRSWSFRGVAPELKRKYWQALPDDCYRIDERARALVQFSPLNLESEGYPAPANGTDDLDIIFCRNVTIYFRPHTVKKVLRRFHDCLAAGGFLLTGAAEYSREAYRDFAARAFPETVIYQK